MLNRLMAEIMKDLAESLEKDKSFRDFKEKMMKDEGFQEYLRKKKENKEDCNCIRCTMFKEVINSITEKVQKEVDGLSEEKLKKTIEFFEDDIEKGGIEDFDKARGESKRNLEKAIRKYVDDSLIFLTITRAKENSNG